MDIEFLRKILFRLSFQSSAGGGSWNRILRRLMFQAWYFKQPPWDTQQSPPELLAFIRTRPAGRALDLGCGTGTNVITLAQHGWQAAGIDFAWRAIRMAKAKAEQAQVQCDLRVGDVTNLEGLQGQFDLILDIGCYHNLPPEGRPAYRQVVEQRLAPGGTFLLYTFIKPGEAPGPGVSHRELEQLGTNLRLSQRQDGTDRGGERLSAWLSYTKKQ